MSRPQGHPWVVDGVGSGFGHGRLFPSLPPIFFHSVLTSCHHSITHLPTDYHWPGTPKLPLKLWGILAHTSDPGEVLDTLETTLRNWVVKLEAQSVSFFSWVELRVILKNDPSEGPQK